MTSLVPNGLLQAGDVLSVRRFDNTIHQAIVQSIWRTAPRYTIAYPTVNVDLAFHSTHLVTRAYRGGCLVWIKVGEGDDGR